MKKQYMKASWLRDAILVNGLLCLVACTDDMGREFGEEGTETNTPILLTASYQQAARASELGFADGDDMGVYITAYFQGKPGDLNDSPIAKNLKFEFDEAQARWNGAATIFWPGNDAHIDVYGYYPFDSQQNDPNAYYFTVNTNQDKSARPGILSTYEASDLLWAQAIDVAPTTSAVNLNYNHALSGVTIRITEGTGFAEGEFAATVKQAWVESVMPSCNVDIVKQKVEVDQTAAVSITPLEYNGEFRAVVPPQTVKAGAAVVSLTIGGDNYKLVKDAAITYVSGKMHTFTLKVDKRTESGDYAVTIVDQSITAWIDDPDFHDGLVREYMVVNVETPGTIAEVLATIRVELENISGLKLTGAVDWDDLAYVRDHLVNLESINLYEVIIDDKFDENDYVLANLNQMRWLRHVILPRKLKGVADNAFLEDKLMGMIAIPEGVEWLGNGSFAQHGGNGDYTFGPISISLPTTLRRIGSYAFGWTIIANELSLPDGIEYIGTGAFNKAGFRNQPLVLPESLKELGAGVFSGSFVGDLVIPQGLKKIDSWAFSIPIKGNVEIPEGVEVIEFGAFGGAGLKGELVIPSTVQRLARYCFQGNKFTKIIWPENLKMLEGGAFAQNDRLGGTVTIPKNINYVPYELFEGCSLITGIELHKEVEYIGENAFAFCERVTSIVCHSEEPPLMKENSFDCINYNNVTVEVTANAVEKYKSDKYWKRFHRITAHRDFLCRPQHICALNKEHSEEVILNAKGPWSVTHIPEWCTISNTSGTGKTSLYVSFDVKDKGTDSRIDYIEFTLDGTDITTRLEVGQYDYEYDEDQFVELQQHSKGEGIKIFMLGDGWDAQSISSGDYMRQCVENMESFFGLAPYDRLRDYFDVYAAIALSQDTGINTVNTYVNTKFQSIYTYGSTYTPLGGKQVIIPDEELIFPYITDNTGASFGDLHRGLTILIPNTTNYPSITYYYGDWEKWTISVCPPSENPYPNDSRGVIQHEAGGHGFGKLADESISKNAFIVGSVATEIRGFQERGWFQNISLTGNLTDVPWAHFIFDPRYSDKVDVFEGAYGYTRSVYRSESNSCMNFGIPYYNAISRQDITKRILETAGESFDIEDFYANDTQAWGSTSSSASRSNGSSTFTDTQLNCFNNHAAPVFVQGDQMQKILKEARARQPKNKF